MPETLTSTGFTIPDPPDEADLLRCVRCGLCLQHCPTYRLTGLETESPRGRIFLVRELAEGNQTVNQPFKQHTGLCLDCRNCESVCPSGVRFGVLIEAARGEVTKTGKLSLAERALRWLILKQVFSHPSRLNGLVQLAALYQSMGLQTLLRRSSLLNHIGRVGELEGLLPTRRLRTFRSRRSQNPSFAIKTEKGTVALFTGCIMRAGFAGIHEATVRVLERNGWRVRVPEEQVCCGALHVHSGERDWARELARKNIDLFLKEKWDAIAVNAAGCGANLKEYPELFRVDPVYRARAVEFSSRVRDITELLGRELLIPVKQYKHTVTYQDACHLAHAQRIRLEPRRILNQIPGLKLIEMRASDRCCGSAGIYNVLHPEIANQLIDEKMANTRATDAEIVVTANIGCLLQLEYGKRRTGWKGRVLHIVELLEEAYGD